MNVQTRSGLWSTLLSVWHRNQDLLRNAGSLAATSGLTSMLGFVYWFVAAKEFSQSAVGFASAAVSAMTLLGTVGEFGLGTMLIGELPKRERSRGGLFAAALIASAAGSLVLGFIFPAGAAVFGFGFPSISGTAVRLGIFAIGVAITGSSIVFDEGTIALMRGGIQLSRNTTMSITKLAILPLFAAVLHDGFGVGLVLSWVLGSFASYVPTVISFKRAGTRIFYRPDWGLLRRLGKVAMAHNWLNLALATPPRLIPVLVTAVVSPSANAAFYVAWMLASFLFMVPMHLSTVLFAIASASPEVIAEKLRFVLRVSLMIGLPIMAGLAIFAHLVLGLFGPGYSQLATLPLWLLIIGYIPGLPKAQYIAVCRATGKITKAAAVLSIAASCEICAVVIGGKIDGLDGLSYAYLFVVFAEGAVTAPTVLRAAYARTAVSTNSAPAATGPLTAQTAYLVGQEAGLAALFAIASTSMSEGHTLDITTEVWRTGTFPAIPMNRPRESGRHSARITASDEVAYQALSERSYRRRQQAGVDALIAIATPVLAKPEGHQHASQRSRR